MPEDTQYYRKLTEITEIPAPDDLVQGSYQGDVITVGAGEYSRGELMMSNAEGIFVPATASGLESASEAAILSETLSVPEGNTASVYAYFGGKFNAGRIVLSYETESDSHDELIEAVRPILRKRRIFVND